MQREPGRDRSERVQLQPESARQARRTKVRRNQRGGKATLDYEVRVSDTKAVGDGLSRAGGKHVLPSGSIRVDARARRALHVPISCRHSPLLLSTFELRVDEGVDVVQPLSITTSSPLHSGIKHARHSVTLRPQAGRLPTHGYSSRDLSPRPHFRTGAKIAGTRIQASPSPSPSGKGLIFATAER